MQLLFYFCWRSAKSRRVLTNEPFMRSKASLTIFISNKNNIFWSLGKLLSALCSLRGEKQTRGSDATDLTTVFHSMTVPLLFFRKFSFSRNKLLLLTSSKHSVFLSQCSKWISSVETVHVNKPVKDLQFIIVFDKYLDLNWRFSHVNCILHFHPTQL